MKTATYTIQGITPLMIKSDRSVNPFDPGTQALKALTGKKKKTEDDIADIARVEWMVSLYDEQEDIFIPGFNLFACMRDAGKLRKMGTTIKRAVIVQDDRVALQFDGPKKPADLFKDKAFVDIRSVGVSGKRVQRCRPLFKDWRLQFTVLYEESAIQRSDLDRILQDAGPMIGLGDYRPRFGRFEVVSMQ